MHRTTKLLGIALILILASCRPATPTEAPTETSAPQPEVRVIVATSTPRPTAAPRPTALPTATATPAPTETPLPEPTTPAPTETPLPTATAVPTKPAQPAQPAQPATTSYTALTLLPDTDPAPPLTLIVSANRALEGDRYLVTGWMRNDSTDQTYTGMNVVATFFFQSGRRYSPIRSSLPCSLLAPGDTCPFVVTANARDLVEVLLHPEGHPTDRQPVPLTASGLSRYTDAVGYVHLTGRVSNPNAFAVKNVSLTGTLIDSRGEVVSAGVANVLETLAPGAQTPFDMRLPYWAYSTYRVDARAETK